MKWGLRMTEQLKRETAFSKSDLLKSKRYVKCRDILNAILSENEMYTIKQVDKMIKNFLSKEVK